VPSTVEDFLAGKASLAFETIARFLERIKRDAWLEKPFYRRFHESVKYDPFELDGMDFPDEWGRRSVSDERVAMEKAFQQELKNARAALESSARSEGMLPSLEERVANEATSAEESP
jgi:hypothetical protein